jgi:hypothetical protein
MIITYQIRGHLSMGLKISPTPRAMHGLFCRKKGTSAPRSKATPASSRFERGEPHLLLRAFKTQAASVLPPPKPADTGMFLVRMMESPSVNPVREKKALAALWTRFSLSAGTEYP